jgi:hypothetical protein
MFDSFVEGEITGRYLQAGIPNGSLRNPGTGPQPITPATGTIVLSAAVCGPVIGASVVWCGSRNCCAVTI